ncbi:MAG: MtrB/PioB family decaheme-associated outer membrane protein [Nitrosomonadales bacterium]|nr:MtrB/PioB family decaheme-associated outer membrane protein [Nitrosomonadales bacterium]
MATAPVGWAGTIDTTPGGAINAPVAATIVTTAMMSALAANMKAFNVQTKRKGTTLGVTKQITGGWNVAVNYKREDKDGTKLTGAPFQIAGAGSRGTLLAPEPINYTTDLFDVTGRYADEKLQAQVSYHASLFNNANRSLVFDNLYYNALSTVGGSTLTGQLGQMPDNQFHQISASGGYSISKETRLSGSLSIGRMTQNEAFLPYITSGALVATAPTVPYVLPGLPVASLNGRVDTTHLDVKLHTKLTHEAALTAGYKYDDRDNRTPINQYFYLPADNNSATSYTNTAASQYRRNNTPLSKTQQQLYADVDYELSEATRLKFGYDFDKITHTYEPTAGDHEHTLKAEVKHNFSETASGGLAYAYSDRNADTYNGALPLYSTYQIGYLASICVAPNTFVNPLTGAVVACTGVASAVSAATMPFLDTPSLEKFFLTDRKRDKLRAYANVSPSEKLDLQFGASYYKERYPAAQAGFGLAKATGWSANLDANWAATEAVNGMFFATFEDYSTDQNGHNGASSAVVPVITTLDRQNNTAAFDPLTGTTTRTDRSLTLGLGFKVKQNDSLDWGANFTHASTVGSTRFRNIGARIAATVLPVPDTLSRLSRLELFGKYRMQKDLTLNVKYALEQYNSNDWAWDGQTLTSSTTFIGSGQTSPDYNVHVIAASLTYSFK